MRVALLSDRFRPKDNAIPVSGSNRNQIQVATHLVAEPVVPYHKHNVARSVILNSKNVAKVINALPHLKNVSCYINPGSVLIYGTGRYRFK